MNFSLPHPERGAPLRDEGGRWLPGAMTDGEIRAELPAATDPRQQALTAELRDREGRDGGGDLGLDGR